MWLVISFIMCITLVFLLYFGIMGNVVFGILFTLSVLGMIKGLDDIFKQERKRKWKNSQKQ